jgi:hypothetical protein
LAEIFCFVSVTLGRGVFQNKQLQRYGWNSALMRILSMPVNSTGTMVPGIAAVPNMKDLKLAHSRVEPGAR